MQWTVVDTGKASAEKNMAIDYALLRELADTKQPVLHLYEWEAPSVTYGHFLDPYKYLRSKAIEKYGLQVARRPTGGGIVLHLTDLAFSVLIPSSYPGYSLNTLENYAFINRIIAEIIQEAFGVDESLNLLDFEPESLHPFDRHFCMAKATQNDVMWQGKKIAGGAQRRTKHGFLHQGTISMELPPASMLNELLCDSQLAELMYQNNSTLPNAKVTYRTILEKLKSM